MMFMVQPGDEAKTSRFDENYSKNWVADYKTFTQNNRDKTWQEVQKKNPTLYKSTETLYSTHNVIEGGPRQVLVFLNPKHHNDNAYRTLCSALYWQYAFLDQTFITNMVKLIQWFQDVPCNKRIRSIPTGDEYLRGLYLYVDKKKKRPFEELIKGLEKEGMKVQKKT
ncbi:hypothetical protein D9758_017848 [Tetrapyrgos nigripes]|uniref:Uncharacterized protein n=1 Tax=Tetrapyrgos nigripes TaxID=182062 RepID=A0A8H5F9B1_9AGAR|nr:hypothetical protein D9758_017848 [Tetrapyrgos nigripes]